MAGVFVPGIHSLGDHSTRRFAAAVESRGFHVEHPELAVRNVFTARFMVNRDARQVQNVLRHGDDIVAHSYGCLRGTRAAEFAYRDTGEIINTLYLIAPAMSKYYDFSKLHPDTRVVCLYSPDDKAIGWGRRLILHPFGGAGQEGFLSSTASNFLASGNDHNDYFSQGQLEKWVEHYLQVSSAQP